MNVCSSRETHTCQAFTPSFLFTFYLSFVVRLFFHPQFACKSALFLSIIFHKKLKENWIMDGITLYCAWSMAWENSLTTIKKNLENMSNLHVFFLTFHVFKIMLSFFIDKFHTKTLSFHQLLFIKSKSKSKLYWQYDESGYNLDLDLVTISYQPHVVSYPRGRGLIGKSNHSRPHLP